MQYLSVCSGIEAATVAWHPLGWRPVAFSDIEPFPSAVLAHHYPNVPNLGNMERYLDWKLANFDILVGGTPCQSFSVAGLRAGLDDPRGNLALVYLAIAERFRPEWLVWENVPGVLSSNGGRDFGAFLGALVKLGYGFAYRVLNAQYFGIPQRRRRVFVVANSRGWQRAAAILFERESLCRHSAPGFEAGKRITRDAAPSIRASGRDVDRVGDTRGQDQVVAHALTARDAKGPLPDRDLGTVVTHTLTAEYDASEDGSGRGLPIIAPTLLAGTNNTGGNRPPGMRVDNCELLQIAAPLTAGSGKRPSGRRQEDDDNIVSCFDETQVTHRENRSTCDPGSAGLSAMARPPSIATTKSVRRLMPIECERLQGFPDNYTLIEFRGKPATDSVRYRALGNSMAVPVMAWIGQRIALLKA